MKKPIAIALILSMMICVQAQAQNAPSITINNNPVYDDAFIKDGVTYVPLRTVSENLGASVSWDEATNSVTITSNTTAQLITQTIEKVSPSVVGIMGSVKGDSQSTYQDKYKSGIALGTGVIIKSGGEILTNAHVVKDMESIIVVLSDGNGYQARLKYIDESADLAVIKIEKLGLTVVKFANADEITVGEPVVAIGTPLSLSLRNSATSGIISGLNRTLFSYYTLIQTDTAINPGNSGGPLVNLRGEVVGINSSKYSAVGIEGMCFSIPVGTVKYVLNQFDTYGRVKRPNLGVEFGEDWAALMGLPTQQGLTIKAINSNKENITSKLNVGDIVLAVEGNKVHSIIDWNEQMKNYLPNQEIVLTITKLGQTNDVKVKLGE